MPMFRVSSSELRNKASQLEQMNDQFKRAVDKLASQEQNLAGMWEGDAQREFHRVFNDDRLQFDNFYKGIVKYIQTLREAAEEYDRAEAKNVETARIRR